jgi:hypothetical protein
MTLRVWSKYFLALDNTPPLFPALGGVVREVRQVCQDRNPSLHV